MLFGPQNPIICFLAPQNPTPKSLNPEPQTLNPIWVLGPFGNNRAGNPKPRLHGSLLQMPELKSSTKSFELGLRVKGLGFRVWGLGFRVWGLGFRV